MGAVMGKADGEGHGREHEEAAGLHVVLSEDAGQVVWCGGFWILAVWSLHNLMSSSCGVSPIAMFPAQPV